MYWRVRSGYHSFRILKMKLSIKYAFVPQSRATYPQHLTENVPTLVKWKSLFRHTIRRTQNIFCNSVFLFYPIFAISIWHWTRLCDRCKTFSGWTLSLMKARFKTSLEKTFHANTCKFFTQKASKRCLIIYYKFIANSGLYITEW